MKHYLVLSALRMLGLPRWMTRLVMLIVLASSFSHLWAGTIEGRVVGVSDGDTITVLTEAREQFRVRLQGIDAPESKQAFGNVSKRSLSDLVFSKTVEVRFDKEDRYGRILGVVYAAGLDVNLTMVSKGMAWHYKHYQRDQSPNERRLYAQAEDDARASGLGLWRDPHAIAPWDFRRSSN